MVVTVVLDVAIKTEHWWSGDASNGWGQWMASARKSRAVTTAIHHYWNHIATGKWCKQTSGKSRNLITCNKHFKTSRFELLLGFAIGRVHWHNIVNGAHNKQLLSYGKWLTPKTVHARRTAIRAALTGAPGHLNNAAVSLYIREHTQTTCQLCVTLTVALGRLTERIVLSTTK